MTTTTSVVSGPQVEHIHPDTILIEDNIREAVHLDDGFVASIREHGVIQPVLAVRNPNGTLSVRDGQRRTLGARAAGVKSIPAYVVEAGDDRALRIIQQIIANDQRTAITEAERVEAFHQLALEGLSVAAIAKRTGHSKDRIRTSVSVASKTATQALATNAVTLDAALILADFDGDEDATAYLLDVATDRPSQLGHAAQRLRDERARTAIVTQAVAALHEQGTPTVTEGDEYQRLTSLTDAADDADTRPELDAEEHTAATGTPPSSPHRGTEPATPSSPRSAPNPTSTTSAGAALHPNSRADR